MFYSSTIKKAAKDVLRDRWSTAVGVLFTCITAFLAVIYIMAPIGWLVLYNGYKKRGLPMMTAIPVMQNILFYVPIAVVVFIAVVAMLFIAVPTWTGGTKWHFDLAKENNPKYTKVFSFFGGGYYFKSIALKIGVVLRRIGWLVVYSLPIAVLWGGIYLLIFKNLGIIKASTALSILVYVLLVLIQVITAVLVFIYKANMNKYFLAKYLISSNGKISASRAVKMSVNNMQNYNYNLMWFKISFIGWFILSVIFFPLLMYVVPYYRTALAVYAKTIIKEDYTEQTSKKAKKTKKSLKTNSETVAVQAPEAKPPEPMDEVPPIQQVAEATKVEQTYANSAEGNAAPPQMPVIQEQPLASAAPQTPPLPSEQFPPIYTSPTPIPQFYTQEGNINQQYYAQPTVAPEQPVAPPIAPPIYAQPQPAVAPQPQENRPPIYIPPEGIPNISTPNDSREHERNPNWGEEFNFNNSDQQK